MARQPPSAELRTRRGVCISRSDMQENDMTQTQIETSQRSYDSWLRSVSRKERAASFRSLYSANHDEPMPDSILQEWLSKYDD
jgi:hypothetical protein